MATTAQKRDAFEGFHAFPDTDQPEGDEDVGGEYGSFEVFWLDVTPGWYWHACFPGCLPDGEPSGPFPTAEGAYLDAIGE